jgi:ABC-type branched-subunit amino acid transport system substrate-binding protein
MKYPRLTRALAVAAVVALAATGCSNKAPESDNSGGGGGGGVKTGPGVTADTISLGVLTDLHGVFAALGTSITNAQKLYWKSVNDDGGICGRQVKLVIKDHGYDVQQAVTLYAQMTGQVAGFANVLGSPINTALLDSYTSDQQLVIPVSWASTLLSNDQIMVVGATYDYEMVDAVDYLVEQGTLKSGDKIGHIYFEGEYGENGLMGTKFAAEKDGLTLVPVKVKATDTDLSAQVTSLKSKGVKAIFLTISPTATASVAAVTGSLGWNVKLVGSNPSFAPGILDTAAADTLESNYIGVASWQQPASDDTAVQSLVKDYAAAYPKAAIDGGITWGWAAGEAYKEVLDKACDNKDLSREGLLKAFRETTSADTGGLVANLDYSKKGESPTKSVYIFQPDKSLPGGLKQISDLYEGKDATSYVAPALGG